MIDKTNRVNKEESREAILKKKYEDGIISYNQYQQALSSDSNGESLDPEIAVDINSQKDLPFFSDHGEEVIRDTSLILYGVDKKFFLAGTDFDYKKSISSHLYLTDKRLVFVNTDIRGKSIFSSECDEKILGTINKEIPLDSINSISAAEESYLKSLIDLSFYSNDGKVNSIRIIFFSIGKDRTKERDEWINLIRTYKQKLPQSILDENGDPIKILKVRYAKGEITKKEYEEMLNVLK